MAGTKRSQNRCKACGYTWYPRGKNISSKCPDCGSRDVGVSGGALGLGALLIVGFMIFGGGKDKPPAGSPAEVINPASAQEDLTVDPTAAPVHETSQQRTVNVPEPLSDASAGSAPPESAEAAKDCETDGKTSKCPVPDAVRNKLF
jgi:hypothetical protein